ncbi:MAG: hypothetical protein V1743_01185 [Nanoarchaeota archaeon]
MANYLYVLSKEYLDLSSQEVLLFGTISKYVRVHNLLLVDKQMDYSRLAYTKAVFSVLFSAISPERFIERLNRFDCNKVYRDSFSFRILDYSQQQVTKQHLTKQRLTKAGLTEKGIAGIMYGKLKNPKVDLRNARTQYFLILSDHAYFFTTLLWKNTENFSSRKSHHRPAPHPTSLHPRLARCLINLLNPKSFLDPFCGSGGILIEGGLLGIHVEGIDLDPIMIRRAQMNLEHYGIKTYALHVGDALTITKRVEAIITDLPYGRNSKVDNVYQTYAAFVRNAEQLTRKMIVIFPDFINSRRVLKGTRWRIIHAFSYYLHRTLSKNILLLERN